MAKQAIVRPPGNSYRNCISAHRDHNKLDIRKALEQHAKYVDTLKDLGLDVIELSPEDELPDACFVEDTVVIHGNRALMTRPTHESRRGEIEGVEDALWDYFQLSKVVEPATLEGGDVIHIEDKLVSGETQRTNSEGIQYMRDALQVQVDVVSDANIVHLKSYVTYLDKKTLVGISRYVNHPAFDGLEFIVIPDDELYASNTLTIHGTVIIPDGYPETAKLIEASGYDVIKLPTSEFARCEGALTCLSIIF
ncbi:MAG: arginine deiminase family protein [Candidatus Thorarchaeota archaeon]|nr:arginine deiminase family protein [Candidatus Thorarchaeota archaeon]